MDIIEKFEIEAERKGYENPQWSICKCLVDTETLYFVRLLGVSVSEKNAPTLSEALEEYLQELPIREEKKK